MSVTIAIVGLGYVGLPLAHAFAKKGYRMLGYDINTKRIATLQQGEDWTGELTAEQLKETTIEYSADPSFLKEADMIIVALPTPIDAQNKPDITILKEGTEVVGTNMREGAIVVFESTVYPGTTEEICGPILTEASGGKSFSLGYSPERVNPGDKEHTIEKIVKVVAGQDEKTTDRLVELYGSIIEAGVHRAPSIKVAEMAKAIENAQRDLNIAFVNEIALLCNAIGISTKDVLAAAGTKWNFLQFIPGLVGGHCIGVDPYYLVEKARQLNIETHIITAGRSVNDGMGTHVAQQVLSALSEPREKRVLVLGVTFKENITDTRNSKSGDVIAALEQAGCTVEVLDPCAPPEAVQNWPLGTLEGEGRYDAILLLVPHKEYMEAGEAALLRASKEGAVIYDLKSVLDASKLPGRKYMAL